MFDYSRLIKFALWAMVISAVIGFAWHVSASIHDNIYQDGRLAERAEWHKKEAERANRLAREIAEAVERLNSEREKQVSELTGALDYANKAKDKLNHDLNTVRAANRGLWISAQNCANSTDAAAGKTKDPGISGSGPERIRLPGPVEQDLWELAADAQRVVIQYETCRKTLMPLVEIINDPG